MHDQNWLLPKWPLSIVHDRLVLGLNLEGIWCKGVGSLISGIWEDMCALCIIKIGPLVCVHNRMGLGL